MNLAITGSFAIRLSISYKQLIAKVSSLPLHLSNYPSSGQSVCEVDSGLVNSALSSLILFKFSMPYLYFSSLNPFLV